MRITSKGQVAIPIGIREKAGLMPNTEVEFAYEGEEVLSAGSVAGKRNGQPSRGERLVAHMRGRGDGEMTTEEIWPSRAENECSSRQQCHIGCLHGGRRWMEWSSQTRLAAASERIPRSSSIR